MGETAKRPRRRVSRERVEAAGLPAEKLNPELVRQIADLLRDVLEEERGALIDEARRIAFAAKQLMGEAPGDIPGLMQAAVRVLLDAALRLLQDDPHMWSHRPCATCRAVSSIVGRPFGCLVVAEQRSGAEGTSENR